MTVWIRPSGNELETNDRPETIAYAESLGWKRKDEEGAGPTTKAECIAYAKEHFDIDLDATKSAKDIKTELAELIEASE